MSLIFCPQCGTENEETNHECRACAYDFMSGSVLICPICQYENHPLLDKCKQCGTDLTAVSAVSDPESEDAQADLARITGPLPAPPTRKFTPGGNSENQSQAKESENFDTWLDEVISGKSDDEFGGDSEDETPIWAVGSGLSLGDTMELEEESLPDWLKSLKEADEDKEEEPAAAPERKMAGWLDESKLAQLGVTKDLEGEASDSPQSEKEIQNQRQVEQKSENGGQYTGARSAAVTAPLSPEALELQEEQEVDDSSDQQDNWLVELAAMGSVSDSRDEEDEEDTRFVWDESALSSDVGEKAPGWLKELTESEDWPNTISESVIEEWTQKIDDDLVEADDPKRFVTRPLGHTKELDGVPERLVSPALPEWLGDKSEEPSLPIPLEEEITDEFDGAEIEDAEIEDEEPFLVLSDWRDSAEDTLEDTQEIALSGLPELQTEKEDLEMESEPVVEVEDSWDIETPELASALSGTVVEQPVISDDWLDDLAEAEDLIDHRELEPISAIDELLIEDQPVEDSDVVELETADQDIDEQPKVEDVDEVPTWLARLTTKLLDTYDNDFVNEWYS